MPEGDRIEKFKRAKPPVMFTRARKIAYLETFRHDPDLGGRKGLCAEAAGVSASTVEFHLKNDSEFSEAFEECQEAWIDENVYTPALIRARDGVKEPIIGGKFKDEIITHVRKYSDGLSLAFLRAHKAEFRDGGKNGAGSQRGGVMIIPAAPSNGEEWTKTYGELAKGETGIPN